MVVFIKLDGTLEKVAEEIRKPLNLPPGELREGLNIGGGEYYRFQVCGLEIYVIKNRGEVEYKEMSEYPYYISISGKTWRVFKEIKERVEFDDLISRYLADALLEKGIHAIGMKEEAITGYKQKHKP
jgi:hypothetical protein